MASSSPARATVRLPEPGDLARHPIKAWIREAVQHCGRSNAEVAAAAAIEPRRLAQMRSERRVETPTSAELRALSRATGYPVPAEVRSALRRVPRIRPGEHRSDRQRVVAPATQRPASPAVAVGPELTTPDELKAWLRTARLPVSIRSGKSKMSQQMLAAKLKVSRTTVSYWESAQSEMLPSLSDLQAIAKACKVPVPKVSFGLRLSRHGNANTVAVGEAATLSEEILGTGLQLAAMSEEPQKPRGKLTAELFHARYALHPRTVSGPLALATHFKQSEQQVQSILTRLSKARDQVQFNIHRITDLVRACGLLETMNLRAAEEHLRPILGEGLSLRGAEAYATEALGLRLPFHWIVRDMHEPLVAAGAHPAWSEAVQSAVIAAIAARGACDARALLPALTQDPAEPVSLESVSRTLSSLPGFEWLSRESGWFWFGADRVRNGLLDATLEMLSAVEGPLRIDDALEGVRRVLRVGAEGAVPDDDVIRAVWARTPWLAVGAGQLGLARPPLAMTGPMATTLSRDSQLLRAAMRGLGGGPVSRADLRDHLIRFEFVREAAVDSIIDRAPWLTCLPDGKLSVRGRVSAS